MDEKGMIKSFDMLRAVKERTLPRLDPESGGKQRVVVGLATCGVAAGAQGVYDAISTELEKQGLNDVLLVRTGCIGICQFEPVVEVSLPHHLPRGDHLQPRQKRGRGPDRQRAPAQRRPGRGFALR